MKPCRHTEAEIPELQRDRLCSLGARDGFGQLPSTEEVVAQVIESPAEALPVAEGVRQRCGLAQAILYVREVSSLYERVAYVEVEIDPSRHDVGGLRKMPNCARRLFVPGDAPPTRRARHGLGARLGAVSKRLGPDLR